MTIEVKIENDTTRAEISLTEEEMRASLTDPVKLRLMIAMNELIRATVLDLYSILMEEEQ